MAKVPETLNITHGGYFYTSHDGGIPKPNAMVCDSVLFLLITAVLIMIRKCETRREKICLAVTILISILTGVMNIVLLHRSPLHTSMALSFLGNTGYPGKPMTIWTILTVLYITDTIYTICTKAFFDTVLARLVGLGLYSLGAGGLLLYFSNAWKATGRSKRAIKQLGGLWGAFLIMALAMVMLKQSTLPLMFIFIGYTFGLRLKRVGLGAVARPSRIQDDMV